MLLERGESPERGSSADLCALSSSPGSSSHILGCPGGSGGCRAEPRGGLLLFKPSLKVLFLPQAEIKEHWNRQSQELAAEASSVWNFRGAHSETVLRNYVKVYSRAFFNLCRLREHKASQRYGSSGFQSASTVLGLFIPVENQGEGHGCGEALQMSANILNL